MMAIGVRTCRVLLESGFTGYVGASCAHDIDAQLKMAIAQDIIPGPRIRACGHHIGTTGDMNNRGAVVEGLRDAGPRPRRRRPRRAAEAGPPGDQPRASRRSRSSPAPGTASPNRTDAQHVPRRDRRRSSTTAHERGAKVRAHVADREMILECIELGVDVIDHGDEIDDEIIEQMVAAGHLLGAEPRLPLEPVRGRLRRAVRRDAASSTTTCARCCPMAQQAGVRILVGDDYSGVFRTLIEDDPLDHQVGNYGREFAFYGEIDGLSPADVLSWGTAQRRAAAGGPAGEGRRRRSRARWPT